VLEPAAPRGLRMPIDFFFGSAADQKEKASALSFRHGKRRHAGHKSNQGKPWHGDGTGPISAKYDACRAAPQHRVVDFIAPAKSSCQTDPVHPSHSTPAEFAIARGGIALLAPKVFVLLRAARERFFLLQINTINRRSSGA